MKQVIKHRDGGLLNMIRRTDPMIFQFIFMKANGGLVKDPLKAKKKWPDVV